MTVAQLGEQTLDRSNTVALGAALLGFCDSLGKFFVEVETKARALVLKRTIINTNGIANLPKF